VYNYKLFSGKFLNNLILIINKITFKFNIVLKFILYRLPGNNNLVLIINIISRMNILKVVFASKVLNDIFYSIN
jgi:hypothetical protein